MPVYQFCFCNVIQLASVVLSGQRGGVAFTPVAPPSRQRPRVVVRQHSSDSILGNSTIRMVTF